MADILDELKPNEFNKTGDESWKTYAEFIDSMTTYLAKNPNTQHFLTVIETLLSNENDCDMINVMETLFNNEEFKEAIAEYCEELFPMNVIRMEFGKNHDEAIQAYKSGTMSHCRKEYVDALKQYSKAIRFAEQETSDYLLPILYDKRSLVFCGLKKYYDCVLDIQELLRHNHVLSMGKIITRMAQAAANLTDCENTDLLRKVINDCMQNMFRLDEMQRAQTRRMLNQIELNIANGTKTPVTKTRQKSDKKSNKNPPAKNSPENMVTLPFDFDLKEQQKNPSINGASKKLSLSLINDKKYRGYLAQENIDDGELVFVEKPFAIHYFISTYDTHCGNCLKRLYNNVPNDSNTMTNDYQSALLQFSGGGIDSESSINFHMEYSSFVPCYTCNKFIFCDRKCLNEAYERFHKRECQWFLFSMESQMGIGYLAARLISAAPNDIVVKEADLDNYTAIINQKKMDKNDRIEDAPTVMKGGYGDILRLMTHSDEHDDRSKICFILTAFFFDYCFEKMHLFNEQPAKPDRLGLMLLVIHHLEQLSTNFMTIYEQEFVEENLSQSEELPIGIGIYTNMALLNHSCEPDLIPIYVGGKMVLKSVKTIQAGQEVCISYGPTYYNLSYLKRQKWLKEQYFFHCACEACLERKENYNYAFLCVVCNGPALLEYTDEPELKPYLVCRNGHQIDDLQPILAIIKKGIQHRKAGEHFLEQGVRNKDDDDIVAALVSFYNADIEFTNSLYCLNHMYINLKNQMIDCYLKMGHNDRAAIYSRQIIASYKKYPKNRELLMSNIREHVRLIKILMLMVEELELHKDDEEDEEDEEKESDMVIPEEEEGEVEREEALPEVITGAHSYFGQDLDDDIETAIDAVEAIQLEPIPIVSTVAQKQKVDDEVLKEKKLKLRQYYDEIMAACKFCLEYRKILPQNILEFVETTMDKIQNDEYYNESIKPTAN